MTAEAGDNEEIERDEEPRQTVDYFEELREIASHCQNASNQLREMLDIPSLESLAATTKTVGRASSGSWQSTYVGIYYADFKEPPAGSRFNPDAASADEWRTCSIEEIEAAMFGKVDKANFERIKRVASAALDGFKLDREDLLDNFHQQQSLTHNKELEVLETELINLLPRTHKQFINELHALFSANKDESAPREKVPPHVNLLADLELIRQSLTLYESTASIAEKAVHLVAQIRSDKNS